MKLVDILVENLNEWPQCDSRWDQYEVDCVVQDPDGIIYAHHSHEESPCRDGNEWREVWYNDYVSNLEVRLAEDHATAIVTKQMWLDAKAYKEAKEQTAKFTDLTKGSIHLPKVVSSNSLDPNSTGYKIAVMQHYLNGGKIQVKGVGRDESFWADWVLSYEPKWCWDETDYRIKSEPAHILPEIPWDVIEDKYKWFAFDRKFTSQKGYLFSDEPSLCRENECWYSNEGCTSALNAIKFNKGNVPWDKSLVKRPE